MKKNLFFVIALSAVVAFSFTSRENQLLKTSLKITVLNELGNPEEGVVVKLYKTEKDYEDETNPVGDSILTDKKGRATFKDLEPIVYFVSAEKGKINNHGAGIQTSSLESGKVNKVNIVIE
jgi:hypothetical protein